MYVERETEKAVYVWHNSVGLWLPKTWLKNGKFTPKAWKKFRDAQKKHWKHFAFNALEEFELVRETEKAVQLRCEIMRPNRQKTKIEFWLPKSMTRNWDFVNKKIRELEEKFPYVDSRVLWSGNEVQEAIAAMAS